MYFGFLEIVLEFLSSAHEKWGQKQKWCVYNFGQCMYQKTHSSCVCAHMANKANSIPILNHTQNFPLISALVWNCALMLICPVQ